MPSRAGSEIEIGTFLTERNFPYSAPLTGAIEYRPNDGEPMTIASLHAFVQNQQGDAWNYTLDSLSQFFEAALARKESDFMGPEGSHHPFDPRKVEVVKDPIIDARPIVYRHDLLLPEPSHGLSASAALTPGRP